MSKEHLIANDLGYLLDLIWKIPLLTREQERDLTLKARAGDQKAKDLFVISNMRLVINIAKHYYKKGVELTDLVQEGTFGLVRAIEKFNPDMGWRFSTYATYWIATFVSKATTKASALYIPNHAAQKLNKYCKISNQLMDDADFEKIARAELGDKDFEQSEELYRITQTFFSLENSVGESNFTFGDVIVEEEGSGIEDRTQLREDVAIGMKEALNDKEYFVLKSRYGLFDSGVLELEDISRILGITKERIRQIESTAAKKLKAYFEGTDYALMYKRSK